MHVEIVVGRRLAEGRVEPVAGPKQRLAEDVATAGLVERPGFAQALEGAAGGVDDDLVAARFGWRSGP